MPDAVKAEKGRWYRWNGLTYLVTRMAKDATWADIAVFIDGRKAWTKRQPLPLPEGTERIRG